MGLACEIKYNSGTVYKGGMCKGERHGRGVEVFSDVPLRGRVGQGQAPRTGPAAQRDIFSYPFSYPIR